MIKGVVLDWATMGSTEFPMGLKEGIEWDLYEKTSPEETVQRIKSAEIVLTNKVVLNADNLKDTKVKYIGILATGTNNVDLDYCQKSGITVKNAKGYSTDSVAQHTFSMLFEAISRIEKMNSYVQSGNYFKDGIFTNFNQEYYEIKGKTWGIIGLGTIGAKVAEIAQAFGVNVVYFSSSDENRNDKYQRLSLEQILSVSDIISIHAPLTEKTKGLLKKEELKKMKSNSILLNLGRGGIIREEDLLDFLNDNPKSIACLDVFESEPFDFLSKYQNLKNKYQIICTPHVAWASVEAREELMRITERNLYEWMELK